MGILTDEMRRVVAEQRLGFVATVCPDGTPNLSPKGTIRVWDDDHVMFANICSPGTVANLRRNPAIEINVVDMALRKGYRFKGTATVVVDGPLYERMRETYLRGEHALEPELYRRIDGVVLVRVERAVPLVSPAYDGGASEADVSGPWLRYWETLWAERARSGA